MMKKALIAAVALLVLGACASSRYEPVYGAGGGYYYIAESPPTVRYYRHYRAPHLPLYTYGISPWWGYTYYSPYFYPPSGMHPGLTTLRGPITRHCTPAIFTAIRHTGATRYTVPVAIREKRRPACPCRVIPGLPPLYRPQAASVGGWRTSAARVARGDTAVCQPGCSRT
jgi:hypothetical protein